MKVSILFGNFHFTFQQENGELQNELTNQKDLCGYALQTIKQIEKQDFENRERIASQRDTIMNLSMKIDCLNVSIRTVNILQSSPLLTLSQFITS